MREPPGRLSREAPRVVKLKDWNGTTRSHRPRNAVALAWSANAAMHHRIEEYARRSDGDSGLGRHHASSFGPTSSLRQNQGWF
jgi:hypothetical protein